jgi:SAM-dependent methyltransferase
MAAIDKFAPNWRDMHIHESSPAERGASAKLAKECKHYTATQFRADVPLGTKLDKYGWRCEDLERQSFKEGSFDIVVAQDVFEHLFDPAAAISEITRTLTPGGIFFCTTPLVRDTNPTLIRAGRDANGRIIHLEQPKIHHNPVSKDGSLVVNEWGHDIISLFDQEALLTTEILSREDKSKGILGPLTEVIVSKKSETGGITQFSDVIPARLSAF